MHHGFSKTPETLAVIIADVGNFWPAGLVSMGSSWN